MPKISLDIDDNDLEQLQIKAKESERTLAAQLRFIVKEFLNQ